MIQHNYAEVHERIRRNKDELIQVETQVRSLTFQQRQLKEKIEECKDIIESYNNNTINAFVSNIVRNILVPSGSKVPLLPPSPDREGCIFGLARQKNSIRTTGKIKNALDVCPSPRILHAIWDILDFYSLDA